MVFMLDLGLARAQLPGDGSAGDVGLLTDLGP
jgi:hypothetical protein